MEGSVEWASGGEWDSADMVELNRHQQKYSNFIADLRKEIAPKSYIQVYQAASCVDV